MSDKTTTDMAVIGAVLIAILTGSLLWAELSTQQDQLAKKQVTIRSDESDFVTESRLQETFNSAETDRQVALFNLQNNTAKEVFSDKILVMGIPARLLLGKKSKPGKLSPEMQK